MIGVYLFYVNQLLVVVEINVSLFDILNDLGLVVIDLLLIKIGILEKQLVVLVASIIKFSLKGPLNLQLVLNS